MVPLACISFQGRPLQGRRIWPQSCLMPQSLNTRTAALCNFSKEHLGQ